MTRVGAVGAKRECDFLKKKWSSIYNGGDKNGGGMGQGGYGSEWIQEQKLRDLCNKASRRKGGKLTAEDEARMEEIARANMALGALTRWPNLGAKDMASEPCKEMARQALALIQDDLVRAVAVEELARSCVSLDKESGWSLALDCGLDPSKRPDGANLRIHNQWSGVDDERSISNWMAWAASRRAWKCVEAMALNPKARAGCPGFDEEGARLEIGAKKQRGPCLIEFSWGKDVAQGPGAAFSGLGKALGWGGFELEDESAETLAEMEAFDKEGALEAERWAAREALGLAAWSERNHPLLACWAKQAEAEVVEGDRKKAPPQSTMAALEMAGFGPRWGELAFDLAASSLALRGSSWALEACKSAGVGPQVALQAWALAEEDVDMDERRDHLGLALNGAVWKKASSDLKAAWSRVGSWLDETMGEGTAKKMEERAAFGLLEQASRWPDSMDHVSWRGIDSALSWLEGAQAGGSASVARGQVAILQALSIDADEAERGKKPSALRGRLREVLEKWSSIPALGVKRRKPLKA
jgi:hypothetical protein